MSESARMQREKKTVLRMVEIYCHDHHGTHGNSLCQECASLRDYAFKRLERCPFQHGKTTCGKCPVHCYSGKMKEKIVKVMRYAGPRMAWRHPLLAFMHFIDGFRQEPVRRTNRSGQI